MALNRWTGLWRLTGLLGLVIAFGSVVASSAVAQRDNESSGRDSSARQAAGARRFSAQRPVQGQEDADHIIARLLGNMNKAEVELTQYAEGRADVDAVNRFARNQNRQHSQNLEELQHFAAEAGSGIGRSDQSDNLAGNSDGANSGGFNWRQVSQEIANENLRTAKKELRDRNGLDFDWAFVGQQKLLHDAMCANMTVLRRYASPALRQVIDEQLAGVKQDQDTLENLMGQLKQEEQRQYSSRDRNTNRHASTTDSRQRGTPPGRGQSYVDEFAFAEADFTASVRLADGPAGRPTLGVLIDRNAADHARVVQVRPGSPAEQAGLEPGDVILAVNGHQVDSPDDLTRQISRLSAGDRVRLAVDRSFAGERRIPLDAQDDGDRQGTSDSTRQHNQRHAGQTSRDDDSSY